MPPAPPAKYPQPPPLLGAPLRSPLVFSSFLFLVFESAEGGDAGHDPLLLVGLPKAVLDVGAVGRDLHPHDEVGRVACGGQHARPAQDLVDGEAVHPVLGFRAVLHRVEQDDRQVRVQLLGPRVVDRLDRRVPP